MKLSAQHGAIAKKYGLEGSLKILADAGFEAVDFSITGNVLSWDEGFLTDASNPEFAEYFKNIGKIASDNNIEVCMTHAPYCPPFCADPKAYAAVQQQTIRAVYATGYMGSPYIVVHPVLHPDFNNGQNKERCMKTNVDYFSAIVPALKDTGVIMCIENLYWGERKDPKIPNACTTANQLAELIDTLNDMHGQHFAACLDTGHAIISGQNINEMLQVLADRTCTLHIHDNHGILDEHMAPGTGIIDWKGVVRTLNAIDYKGCFNFETDAYWDDFRKDFFGRSVMEDAAKLLYTMGRSMVKNDTAGDSTEAESIICG